MEFRDQEVLERQQVTNLVMEDRMQNKAHFPVERRQEKAIKQKGNLRGSARQGRVLNGKAPGRGTARVRCVQRRESHWGVSQLL